MSRHAWADCPWPDAVWLLLQKAEETYKRALKKHGQSSKVWTLFGEYYLSRGDMEAARELLPRSLKSLPKHKRSFIPSLARLASA